MNDKLRIGKIPYTNLFPVYRTLQDEFDCSGYEFVEGYPSELNRMLKRGEIDVSPSSSIEYLRDEEAYTYIDGLSISSMGPVKSILLFSRVPMESLDGHEIFATHQSETSVALLRIILSEFYGINCEVKVTSKPVEEAIAEHSAYLSIGDEALRVSSGAHHMELEMQDANYELCTIDNQLFYIYDLGELWFVNTALPFVFALWILKKDLAGRKGETLRRLVGDIRAAHRRATERFQELSRIPGLVLPPEEIVPYWEGIDYDLSEDCLKGLWLFRDYLRKLNLLGSP
jgi:chorismate dehydratase